MIDKPIIISVSDLAALTEVIRVAEERGLKAEREVSRLRFGIDEAKAMLDEYRKQII